MWSGGNEDMDGGEENMGGGLLEIAEVYSLGGGGKVCVGLLETAALHPLAGDF